MRSAPIPYLAMLPSEIWLACWTLCSTRQLRRLSLVCHLFRSLCLPLLFQTQSVDTIDLTRGDWITNVHRLHRAAVRLERIVDGPRVRMVRSWTFAANGNPVYHSSCLSHITNIGMVDAMYKRVITAFSSTLGRYQHLRSLNIRELPIDRPFRDTLVSLSMLEEVTLGNCEIPERDGVLLNLKSFAMSSTGGGRIKELSEEPLELVSPGQLQTLKIDGWVIPGYHIRPQSLSAFLTQCPRLQGLSAGKFSRDGLASFSGHIHPETIPLLRSIDAPLDLVLALTPNRPVCDVIVRVIVRAGRSFFPEDIPPEVLDISNASVPVRSLALPTTYPTLESLNTMLSLFPELTSLSMEIDCEEHPRFRCGGRRGRMGKPWTPEIDTRVPSSAMRAPSIRSHLKRSPMERKSSLPPPFMLHRKRTQRCPTLSACMYEILSWICSGLVSLPAEIEVLRFPVRSYFSQSTELSDGHQHQVVAALSRMYPSLRELEMGYHNNPHWERNGTLWKRKGVNSYIQVHA
ncbi:hypothetical protein B0H13DRAFT_2452148 [Mycena leptocephala]|nr:hypothetical protein B0H13DRAFT_2452148 [Mycena leptocephala]